MLVYYIAIGAVLGILNINLKKLEWADIPTMVAWTLVWPLCLIALPIVMYITYKLIVGSATVLTAAGRMKTGNDLEEQLDKVCKEVKVPTFFEFYRDIYKKSKEKKPIDYKEEVKDE